MAVQQVHTIYVRLRDGTTLRDEGWVEENPNGSITIHHPNGDKMIHLRGEYQDWHTEDPTT